MDGWPTPHPPRWYAAHILKLRQERHEEALARVPEAIRALVRKHVDNAKMKGRKR